MNKKGFLILFFAPAMIFAQLGSKMNVIMDYIGADQIIKTEFKRGYLIQDIKTGTKEITSIYYNLDSVAIVVAVGRKDSFFQFREMINFQKNNVPKYRANIKCMEGNTTYHWDTVHQILLLISYSLDVKDPVMTSFSVTKDRTLIDAWTREKKGWIKE
jgi:hypothetical protein